MRCSVAMLAVALAAGAGCRSSCDKVESELRNRETEVRELREELGKYQFYNRALVNEVAALRGEPGPDGCLGRPFEAYPVRTLALGRQTGGRASETCPGDDALQVLVEPRDPEGQAIKAPGSLLIEVQEVTAEGLKRPLSAWEVGPEQLRQSWQNGLFTTGYSLVLPWKVWPSTERLRVIARFRLHDGRVFEADKDITVRPAPAGTRPAPPAPEVLPPPTPVVPPPDPPPSPDAPKKEGGQSLPPPRPVPPTQSGPALGDPASARTAPREVIAVGQILRPVPYERAP